MRNLLIALAGFAVGGAAVVGLVVALPEATSAGIKQATPKTAVMPQMNGGVSSMGASMMSAASLPTRKLMIQHVQKGCHVWSDGKTTATMMRLHLKLGQKLSIMDMDVDAHQMLEFSGPMHLMTGGPMMMNHGWTLTFPKKGVYRLGTKTVEMPGGRAVKTIGPDNNLRLAVTVA